MGSPRKQIGGTHYNKHAIQPFDIIDQMLGEDSWKFFWATGLKYMMRFEDKGGLEDLQKAMHYIEETIKRRYPDGAETSSGEVRAVPTSDNGTFRSHAEPQDRV
jgi:hypothetical protein